MSSAGDFSLSRVSPATGFPQAGQLDWVALSRTTLSCSLEVAARLANAGVEPFTILAGSALCSAFDFPPQGQRELINSLSLLKGCSSYSKLLWFGFGVKHIVKTLSETEQGATSVAICAALAIVYGSFHAGQVLREFCILSGAPENLRPGVHQ
jgi:hypothetical protein